METGDGITFENNMFGYATEPLSNGRGDDFVLGPAEAICLHCCLGPGVGDPGRLTQDRLLEIILDDAHRPEDVVGEVERAVG